MPPLAGSVYDEPSLPARVTVVALSALTVRVDVLPDAIEAGFAVIVMVGAGIAVTVTTAVAVTVPPAPVAVAVYVVVAAGVIACVPPVAGNVYDEPSLPAIVTVVALSALTVRVDVLPDTIEAGFAVIVTVGAGFAVTVTTAVAVTVPLAPVAVAVYVVVAAGVTVCVPPVAART